MSSRTPDVQAAYNAYRQQLGSECDFCNLVQTPTDQVVDEHTFFLRIKNRFPYSIWDDKAVTDHQMIIPKRHLVELNEFSPDEAQEFLNLITNYEHLGFSLYARSTEDRTRSVVHQHTHLIKLV